MRFRASRRTEPQTERFSRSARIVTACSLKPQTGAVLIVVLWMLVAFSMLALSFSASVRTEVNAARNTIDQKQSYYMSRAGIEYAVYKILEAQSAFALTSARGGYRNPRSNDSSGFHRVPGSRAGRGRSQPPGQRRNRQTEPESGATLPDLQSPDSDRGRPTGGGRDNRLHRRLA